MNETKKQTSEWLSKEHTIMIKPKVLAHVPRERIIVINIIIAYIYLQLPAVVFPMNLENYHHCEYASSFYLT